MQNYNSNQINKIIEKLFNMDLVRSDNLDISYYTKIIDVTSKGLNAINTKSLDNPQLIRELFERKASQLTASSKNLFEKLRNLRKEISKSINKPAFFICTDKVLREVARQEPGDVDSLLSIKGIGNHFIEEYSSLFLNEIELNTPIV